MSAVAAGANRPPLVAVRIPVAFFRQVKTKPSEVSQQAQATAGTVAIPAPSPSRPVSQQRDDAVVTLNGRRFDLLRQQDWDAFRQSLQSLREQAAEQNKEQKAEKKSKKRRQAEKADNKADAAEPARQNGTDDAQTAQAQIGEAEDQIKEKDKQAKSEESHAAEKPQAHKNGRDWNGKKARAGLDALARVAQQIQDGAQDKAAGIHMLQEVCWAVESNFRTPYTWRESVDLGDALLHTRHLLLNACGRGSAKDPAANLQNYDATDLSRVNPLPSPFWTPPLNIAATNLYTGFDRPVLPGFADTLCDYDSPHKGYGIHPSFEVIQNGRHWKVKFGDERSSEPFACRIFWALGFPVEIVDYTPLVKVHWDRRILTEFNSRKLNTTRIKLAGIPLLTQRRDLYADPFDYIRYAIMKDGSRVETRALRDLLLPVHGRHSRPRHAEQKPSLYDAAFERKIDYLVMQAASFSAEETEAAQEVGSWDYNYLEHPKRREVRGMAVLDAWLENYDVRWGNNKLRLTQTSEGVRLEFIVSDLGGIFGQSAGMIRARRGGFATGLYGNAPNEYGWTCTHPQAARKTTVPIQDYMPATKVKPFYEMNLDDARWMARLIAQFTEPQLKAALIGAGYDAPTARILLEKLVARRDRMMKDFGLGGEIAPLRPDGVNKRLSYNAAVDGPFETTLADGRKIAASDSGEMLLVSGLLKPNPRFQRP